MTARFRVWLIGVAATTFVVAIVALRSSHHDPGDSGPIVTPAPAIRQLPGATVIVDDGRPSAVATGPSGNELIITPQGASIAELIQNGRLHTNLEVRLDAIAALGGIRDPQAALALRSLMDDPVTAVREEVVESFGALGGSDGIAGLDYALLDESESVRQLAIEMLAELGTDEAIGTLARVLDDDSPELRKFVVEELADLKTHAASLMLQRFSADKDKRVSELAMEYLSDTDR